MRVTVVVVIIIYIVVVSLLFRGVTPVAIASSVRPRIGHLPCTMFAPRIAVHRLGITILMLIPMVSGAQSQPLVFVVPDAVHEGNELRRQHSKGLKR